MGNELVDLNTQDLINPSEVHISSHCVLSCVTWAAYLIKSSAKHHEIKKVTLLSQRRLVKFLKSSLHYLLLTWVCTRVHCDNWIRCRLGLLWYRAITESLPLYRTKRGGKVKESEEGKQWRKVLSSFSKINFIIKKYEDWKKIQP